MTWEFVGHEEMDLSDALLLVGMPSGGNVGPVASQFVVDRLKMRVIGGFQSETLPPIGVVRDGIATSPVQMWATEHACGLDGRCDRLLVLRSDVALAPEAMLPLASAVTQWAARERVRLVAALEGYPKEAAPQGSSGILSAASVKGVDTARRLPATLLQQAALMGFGATLLVRANRDAIPAVALFAPVKEGEGEAQAAAQLLRIVDPLVPNIPIDAAELEKQAEQIEMNLQALREEQAKAARRIEDPTHRGYA